MNSRTGIIGRVAVAVVLLLAVLAAFPGPAPEPVLPNQLRPLWSVQVGDITGQGSPYLFDPQLVVVPDRKQSGLLLLDPPTGRERGRTFPLDTSMIDRLGLARDALVVQMQPRDGWIPLLIFGLDGRFLRSARYRAEGEAGPVFVMTRRGLVALYRGGVLGLNVETLRFTWRHPPIARGCEIRVESGRATLVVLTVCPLRRAALTSLDPATGKVHWHKEYPAPQQNQILYLTVSPGDAILAAVPGSLLLLTPDGRTVTHRPLPRNAAQDPEQLCQDCAIGESDGVLVFSHTEMRADGQHLVVTAVDQASGRRLWSGPYEPYMYNFGGKFPRTPSGLFLSTDMAHPWPLPAFVTVLEPRSGRHADLPLPDSQNSTHVVGAADGLVFAQRHVADSHSVTAYVPIVDTAAPARWPDACTLLPRDQVSAAVPTRGTFNGRRAARPTACGFILRDGTNVLVTIEWVARGLAEAERIYTDEIDFLNANVDRPLPSLSPTLRIVRGPHLGTIFDTALIRSGRVIVRVTTQHAPTEIHRIAPLVERRL